MGKVFHVMAGTGNFADHVKKITNQRAALAAKAGVELKRVSFAKVLDAIVALCRVLEIGRDLIGDQAREEWVRCILEELAVTALIPKRKPRSCTRGLCQTTRNWPKIKNPTSKPLVKTIALTESLFFYAEIRS